MCGIAGHLSPRVADPSLGLEMLGKLAHRGPDGPGHLFFKSPFGSIFLGNARLAIVDVPGGNQPYSIEDAGITCVFNGEIYNHNELRSSLKLLGHVFESKADGEVIPHLYLEYGIDGLKKLRGMFAIALFDNRTGKLILARDHFGKKPLYYNFSETEIFFASELKSLMAGRPPKRELDLGAIGLYLQFGFVPGTFSPFEGVKKVGPGDVITWHEGRLTKESFADFWARPERGHADNSFTDIQKSLDAAVNRRLPDEVPFGLFLSGGLDSSLVAESASRLSESTVDAFTVTFPGSRTDESYLTRLTARHLGLNLLEVDFPDDPGQLVREMQSTFDEPNADISILPSLLVSRFARESGKKVMLTGDGGDEVFGGYPKYALLERLARLAKVSNNKFLGRMRAQVFKGLADGATSPRLIARHLSFIARLDRGFDTVGLNWGISKNYFDDISLQKRFPEIYASSESRNAEFWGYAQAKLGPRTSAHFDLMNSDFLFYMPGILQKLDMATMNFGVEARSPFLDRDLFEYSRNLAKEHFYSPRMTKIALRKIAAKVLPVEVSKAPKQGFVPGDNWINSDSVRDLMFHYLSPTQSPLLDLLPKEALLDISPQIGNNSASRFTWPLFTLALWLEKWK
ncbi:MAG: hypothetical protein RI929_297 [Actinomycetota bacterium]|jgi:asparagine synthase (glutamine-hydrolysing)